VALRKTSVSRTNTTWGPVAYDPECKRQSTVRAFQREPNPNESRSRTNLLEANDRLSLRPHWTRGGTVPSGPNGARSIPRDARPSCSPEVSGETSGGEVVFRSATTRALSFGTRRTFSGARRSSWCVKNARFGASGKETGSGNRLRRVQ